VEVSRFLASAIGWLYGGTREAKRAPQPLTSMKPHHQHAWHKLLRESAKQCKARRTLPGGLTGAAALEAVIKRPLQESYVNNVASQYVPIVADKLAEPSNPLLSVEMLTAMPKELSAFYSSEERVLEGGGVDASRRAELRALGRKIGGPREEYVKYLCREDVRPLWGYCSQKEAKALCSFKAVAKKGGIAQRKILPILEANYVFGPPQERDPWGCGGVVL